MRHFIVASSPLDDEDWLKLWVDSSFSSVAAQVTHWWQQGFHVGGCIPKQDFCDATFVVQGVRFLTRVGAEIFLERADCSLYLARVFVLVEPRRDSGAI